MTESFQSAQYLGTICALGNVNGCPKYPDCSCDLDFVNRMRQANGMTPLTSLPDNPEAK